MNRSAETHPTFRFSPTSTALLAAVLLALLALPSILLAQTITPEAAASGRAKLNFLRSGGIAGSNATVTFSELEVNSLLAYDLSSQLPGGVQSVTIQLQQNRGIANARVDFDQVKISSPKLLPRLAEYLFTGTHDVHVESAIGGQSGKAQYEIESVTIDGFPVPAFLVDIMFSAILRHRFPDKALNSPFDMPYSIGTLAVQLGQLQLAGAR